MGWTGGRIISLFDAFPEEDGEFRLPVCRDYKPTFLYRLFDEGDCLLYVGISSRVAIRLSQHFETQPWFPEVGKITWETYPTRYLAEWAEKEAIRAERPLFNKHYSERYGGGEQGD